MNPPRMFSWKSFQNFQSAQYRRLQVLEINLFLVAKVAFLRMLNICVDKISLSWNHVISVSSQESF